MCIIAIKPASAKRPTNEQFKAMCQANPNGFGFMTWSKDKGLQVYKTMSEKEYMKQVKKIPDEQPVVYHMRIATHGSVQQSNCHPFLSDDKHWAFAHNGILSIQNEGDMTDSETFFRRLAVPLLKHGFRPNDNGDFDAMVNTIIGASKFVFMDAHGKIYSYGNFIHDGELYFSNSSYQPFDYRTLLPLGWDCCGTKKGKKKSKKKASVDIDEDLADMLAQDLYDGMYCDPYFYDRSKETIYNEDYKDVCSWATFEMAYDQAEEWMYSEMNAWEDDYQFNESFKTNDNEVQ